VTGGRGARAAAAVELTQCSTVCIVVNVDRAVEFRLKRMRKADVRHAEVGAEGQGAGCLDERTGQTDTDLLDLGIRNVVLVAQIAAQVVHDRTQAVRISGLGGSRNFIHQYTV